MKRFTVTLMICLTLLFSYPVQAEWSAEEEKSLEGLVLGGLYGLEAFVRSGRAFEDTGTEATRGNWSRAMEEITLGLHGVNTAMGLMFNSLNRVGETESRELIVDRAFRGVDDATTKYENAVTILEATPSSSQPLAELNKALISLRSVDRNLAYLNWKPRDWPRSIGPHGDHDRAMVSLARVGRYGLGHLNWDVARFFSPEVTPIFPMTATNRCVSLIKSQRDAFNAFLRMWGQEGGVVLEDDEILIRNDEAAGSGLRDFAFFKLIVSAEYIGVRIVGNSGAVTNEVFSGRRVLSGMAAHLTASHAKLLGKGGCFEQLGRANGAEWVRDQIFRSAKTIGNPDPTGILAEWMGDLPDFWKDMDNWLASVIVFFHEIPAPPGPGPPPECPQFEPGLTVETLALNQVTVNAICRER